jgi:hypothetical protein
MMGLVAAALAFVGVMAIQRGESFSALEQMQRRKHESTKKIT